MKTEISTKTTIHRQRVLPAMGILMLLSASAFWAPPGAAECVDQYGAVVACSAGNDTAPPRGWNQYGTPPAGERDGDDFGSGISLSPNANNSETTFYLRADGTAQTKSAATGCGSAATAMNIGTHNPQTFSPGDTIILCHEGGVFRATLVVRSSGSLGNPIVYDGRNSAIISGADLVSNWTVDGGFVYRANLSTAPQQVFINGQFGDRKDNRSELSNNRDWFWQSDTLYLFSSSGNPDTAYNNPGVEAGVRNYGIKIDGDDNITVTRLNARHTQKNGVFSYDGSHNITITRSTFEWNYLQGIYLTGNVPHDGALIALNTTRMNGAVGILVNADHRDTVIRNNIIHENGKYQAYRHQDQNSTAGIKMWSDHIISRALIEDNVVYDNGLISGGHPGQGVGIWVDMCDGPEGENVVRRNLVYGNRSYGIFIEKSRNTEVSYNVVVDNAELAYTAGIGVKSGSNAVSGNNRVFNNTIYASRWWGLYCGLHDTGLVPKLNDNIFKNNVVVGSARQELWAVNACTNDGYYGTGNYFYHNSFGAERSNFVKWAGSNLSSYNALDSAHGTSTLSIESDPEFFDESTWKLWLEGSSPGVDAGEDLGVDLANGLNATSSWPYPVSTSDQSQHGSGWEIGAFVMTAPILIPPPAFDTN